MVLAPQLVVVLTQTMREFTRLVTKAA